MDVSKEIVCILANMDTNRFHHILFAPSPFPGNPAGLMRHRSVGHHTNGFDTVEAALEDAGALAEKRSAVLVDDYGFEWDGKDVPAMTVFFEMDASGKVTVVM